MSSFASLQGAACPKCQFFDHAVARSHDEGLCRFNPPVSQPADQSHGLWPVVGATDWCGHFSRESLTAGTAD